MYLIPGKSEWKEACYKTLSRRREKIPFEGLPVKGRKGSRNQSPVESSLQKLWILWDGIQNIDIRSSANLFDQRRFASSVLIPIFSEVYGIRSRGRTSASRPHYPWGMEKPVRCSFQWASGHGTVSIFEDYAVFKINSDDETKGNSHVSHESIDPSVSCGPEETEGPDS